MEATVFEEKLSALKNSSVLVSGQNVDNNLLSTIITFSQGGLLRIDYWRLIKNKKHFLSSFDHKQQYGLPHPINIIEKIKEELEGKTISQASFQRETGDIILKFSDNIELQILNFTGYESWEISFSDGTAEYSNIAREYK